MYFFDTPATLQPSPGAIRESPRKEVNLEAWSLALPAESNRARWAAPGSPQAAMGFDANDGAESMETVSSESTWDTYAVAESFDVLNVDQDPCAGSQMADGEDAEELWRSSLSVAVAAMIGDHAASPHNSDPASPAAPADTAASSGPHDERSQPPSHHVPSPPTRKAIARTPRTPSHPLAVSSPTPFSSQMWMLRRSTTPGMAATFRVARHSTPESMAGSPDTVRAASDNTTPRSTFGIARTPLNRVTTMAYKEENTDATTTQPQHTPLSLPDLRIKSHTSSLSPPSSSASTFGQSGSPFHSLTKDYRQVAYLLGTPTVREEVHVQPPAARRSSLTSPPSRTPRLPHAQERSAAAGVRPHAARTTHTQPNAKPRPIHASRGRAFGRPVANSIDLELSLSMSVDRLDSGLPREPRSPLAGLLSPLETSLRSPRQWRALSPPVPETASTAQLPCAVVVQHPVELPVRTVRIASPPLSVPLRRTRRFRRNGTSKADAAWDGARACVLSEVQSETEYRTLLASLPASTTAHLPDPASFPANASYPDVLLKRHGTRNARTTFFLPDTPVVRLTRRRDSSSKDHAFSDGDDASSGTSDVPALPVATMRSGSRPSESLTAEKLGWKSGPRRNSKEHGARQGRVSFATESQSPTNKNGS